MKWFFLFPLVFLLTSCFEFEEVQFKGVENIKMPSLADKEILLSLDVKMDNPNNFKIKIKPSTVDVFIEEKKMATVHLSEKVVLQKNQEKAYPTQLRVKLADGAMFSLLKLTLKKEVAVRFTGKVKGSVYGITKKVDIDQTNVVAGEKLKFNLPF